VRPVCQAPHLHAFLNAPLTDTLTRIPLNEPLHRLHTTVRGQPRSASAQDRQKRNAPGENALLTRRLTLQLFETYFVPRNVSRRGALGGG